MGSPSTCPHGNVIPGSNAPYGRLIPLADLEPDTPARVRRISEVAEHEARSLLLMLAEHAVSEGSQISVVQTKLGPGDIAIRIDGECVALAVTAAQLIWVEMTETDTGSADLSLSLS